MATASTTSEAQEFQHQIESLLSQAKEKLAPVDNWVRVTTKERPALVLAGAFAVGYLLGRLVRRA